MTKQPNVREKEREGKEWIHACKTGLGKTEQWLMGRG